MKVYDYNQEFGGNYYQVRIGRGDLKGQYNSVFFGSLSELRILLVITNIIFSYPSLFLSYFLEQF